MPYLCLEAFFCHFSEAGVKLLQEGLTAALQMLAAEGGGLENECDTAQTHRQVAAELCNMGMWIVKMYTNCRVLCRLLSAKQVSIHTCTETLCRGLQPYKVLEFATL